MSDGESVASSFVASDQPCPDVTASTDDYATRSAVGKSLADALQHKSHVALLGEALLLKIRRINQEFSKFD